MPAAVYMDVHVPAAVTEGLRRRGIDVITSQEDGTREVDDADLLARAAELGRLLLSQDEDLLEIAAQWQNDARDFPGLLFARQQQLSIGELIEDVELVATCCREDELCSQVIYLPLK